MLKLKPVNLLKFLIIAVLLCSMSGCTGKIGEAIGDSVGESLQSQMAMIVPLSVNPQLFYCENSRWPCTYEELELFCSDPNNQCIPVSRSSAAIEFQMLADGRLHVIGHLHNAGDPCTAGKFETTLSVPEPNMCDAYHSRHKHRSADCNQVP